MEDNTKKYNPYHKEAIRISEESKTSLIIDASTILKYSNDMELGSVIREMYNKKCKLADEHIKHINELTKNI
jgi:hypothetical protein